MSMMRMTLSRIWYSMPKRSTKSGQEPYLAVNHLHELAAEAVAAVALVEEGEDGFQTVGKLRRVEYL